MKTTVTTRGQTVIPAKIRRAHRITPRTRLEWVDTSAVLVFMGGEQGAGKVERLLRGARAGRVQVLACSITLMEAFYTAPPLLSQVNGPMKHGMSAREGGRVRDGLP